MGGRFSLITYAPFHPSKDLADELNRVQWLFIEAPQGKAMVIGECLRLGLVEDWSG